MLRVANVLGVAGLGSEEYLVPRDAKAKCDCACTTGRVRHRDVCSVDERAPRAEGAARRGVLVKPDIEKHTPPVGRHATRCLVCASHSAMVQRSVLLKVVVEWCGITRSLDRVILDKH